ncbi:glycosyltransferase family 2 protein [Dongia deserti]|uniref:glycosyltransferase family 2 protein n=1 Tax=Dongia deserti TaxID=2268030 RepID=UPI0013C41A38|nr:glycosyltransferase [Dongia deserti]
MTSDRPDLSIVICTRNRADQLRGTLDSLMAMRTARAWEAILIDNASTDGTADKIRRASEIEPRIRYFREERIGLGAARDRGWREARSDLVTLTDDDCYVAEDYVDAILAAFDGRPDIGVLGGRILLFDPADARVTIDERDYAVEIAPYSFVIAGAIKGANLSFRREALQAIGGFDPELGAGTPFPCEDIDAVAAVLWAGFKGRYDPRPLVRHHHRRRPPDVPRLRAGYDRGRGAYYAKFLLRPECRRAYAAGWLGEVRNNLDRAGLAQLSRELRAAAAYLRSRRKMMPLIALTLPALALYGTAALATGARAVLKPRTSRATAEL